MFQRFQYIFIVNKTVKTYAVKRLMDFTACPPVDLHFATSFLWGKTVQLMRFSIYSIWFITNANVKFICSLNSFCRFFFTMNWMTLFVSEVQSYSVTDNLYAPIPAFRELFLFLFINILHMYVNISPFVIK